MKRLFPVLAMCLLGVTHAAVAHHSAAMFDMSKQVTLQGTVKEFHFTNPHSWIYLAVTDDKGQEVVWQLEGGSVSQMARNGWTYKSIKAGDKVSVTIHPRTDNTPGGSFNAVQLGDGTTLSSSPKI